MEKKFPELYGDEQTVCVHCLLRLLVRAQILTCLVLLRIGRCIFQMLIPIPQQPGPMSRYRRQPTGLPITPLEAIVCLSVFVVICVYVW